MKIERISDNQIKFILTESDLSERDMRLHELSYGSEKAQELFREIMERATVECDFHTTSDTPLIIEAIPVSRDGIMIIVTKVASHADLEDRLGYPPVLGNYKNSNAPRPKPKKKPAMADGPAVAGKVSPVQEPPGQIIFEFDNLENIIQVSARLHNDGTLYRHSYSGDSSVYKYNGKFYLVIKNDQANLARVHESVLKEYSNKFSSYDISKMFLLEHGETIIENNAIEMLSTYLG